jgi:hypothetical protein
MLVAGMEIKQVHEVAYRWAVDRDVRIVFLHFWIWEIVSAAVRQRRQSPVGFDELQNGNVVGVVVRDVAWLGEFGDYERGDSRSIAEEVDGLNVS